MNVFDFALKMEEDGRAYYQKLAAEATVSEFKTIFAMLADAEQEHHDAIAAMKKGVPAEQVNSKVLEKAKNVFQELLGRKQTLTSLKRDPDGFKNAIRIAEEGIKLYEEMAGKETNPVAVKVLLILAAEERKHLEIMENIYDFVEAPHTFLAWGEFSNLKEY